MKKKLLLVGLVFAMLFVFAGCEKKEEEKEEKLSGGWEAVTVGNDVAMEEAEINMFNEAANGKESLKPIALLGKQVVAGTNYMFLALDKNVYKVVIVYKDLEGNASIIKETKFDISKYAHKNIDYNPEALVGGWTVEAPGKVTMLSEDVQEAFDNATSTLTGMTFNPIGVLGKQVVAGTNYAILCYARPSTEATQEYIYLLTLYESLDGKQEIISTAYVNLADFNK